jgi:hypothetical protein
MVIPSVFELQSIKDQLSLLTVLTSHLNWEKYQAGEFDDSSIEDFKQLLTKMDHTVKNLQAKKDKIEDTLDT